jgi:hypothetical protein
MEQGESSWQTALIIFNTIVAIVAIMMCTYFVVKVRSVCAKLEEYNTDVKATIGRLIRELNKVYRVDTKHEAQQNTEIAALKSK